MRLLVLIPILSGGLLLALRAPGGEETSGARKAESSAVAFTPPRRELFPQGQFVYERHCQICHGAGGDGQGEMAAELVQKPRRFTSGLFKYRSTPWGKLPTDSDLVQTIRQGRTGTAMGMFTDLTEEEVRAVVEYIKSFSRKWRRADNYAAPVALPPEPSWMRDPAELERRAAAGRELFQAHCAQCHGESGDGRGPAASALRDVFGDPAPPADLRQPQLRSGNELEDIVRVLSTGLNGTPLVSFAETLTGEQRWEIAAHIATLRAAHAGRE